MIHDELRRRRQREHALQRTASGVRHTARLPAAALAVVVMVAAGPASAQRGEDFAPAGELAVSSNPNEGFPGLFDTELAPKGAFVANLPATGLAYGVTPRLTVGTLAASWASVAVGPPGASVSARYLLGGSTWFRSTLDAVMISGAWIGSDDQATLRVWQFGSNTAIILNPRHRLTGHLWFIRGRLEGSNEIPPMAARAFAVGATYSTSLTTWAALNVTALYLASVTGSIDAPGVVADIDGSGIRFIERFVVRATASLRRGRWLYDLGAFRAGSIIGPWFSVGVQLGV